MLESMDEAEGVGDQHDMKSTEYELDEEVKCKEFEFRFRLPTLSDDMDMARKHERLTQSAWVPTVSPCLFQGRRKCDGNSRVLS